MDQRFIIFLITAILGTNSFLCSQTRLIVHYPKRQKTVQIKEYSIADRDGFLKLKRLNLQNSGYLDTYQHYDSLQQVYHLHTGKQYIWENFKNDLPPEIRNITKTLLPQKGSPFKYPDIENLISKALKYGENNGNPFAQINWSDFKLNQGGVTGFLQYRCGPTISLDSIDIDPSIRIKKDYLWKLLDLKKGELYSQKKIDRITTILAGIPFLSETSSYDLVFQDSKAVVFLNLKHKPANAFDFQLGLAPDASGKSQIIGQFELQLQNLFLRGAAVQLNWQKTAEESQQMHLVYNHPFIINLPFSFNLHLDLLKQDSLFLNRNFKVNTEFKPAKPLSYRFYYRNFSSNLMLENHFEAENLIDLAFSAWGMGFLVRKQTNTYQFKAEIELEAGKRTFDLIASEEGLHPKKHKDPRFFHDCRLSQSINLIGPLNLDHRFTVQGISSEHVFKNDLLRLGGYQSLRGFNENEFYANYFILNNLEFILNFQGHGKIFMLWDLARTRHIQETIMQNRTFQGFGIGGQINTFKGILDLTWAIGKTGKAPFNIEQPRVYLSYKTLF
jgi:hypothetical protein